MRLLPLLVLLTGILPGGAIAIDAKTDYRVGDRLSQPDATAPSPAAYKDTGWGALVPKDWDPMKAFKGLNLSKLKDSDPQAIEALQKLREAWDSAPTEPSLRGERIRIPGFMVPLERKGERVSEFLLVPYFGACIHVPPPPANQIIHVTVTKPLNNAQTMDAVWVSGTLDTVHSNTPWGSSGYRMKADIVAPYTRR